LYEIHSLTKYFKTRPKLFSGEKKVIHAVEDVSFSIMRGETFGLVGESGCGKSTLSRTILRLEKADSGSIMYNGSDIMALGAKELRTHRKKMRMVFQQPYDSLNPRETVREIVSAPLKLHTNLSSREREKEVLRLMGLVGLSEKYISRYPHEFSGGQRQRIGIARAIAADPELIICDEPVSALDVSIQSQILNLLKDIQKEFGLTYLFISHNLAVVKHMSDRIGVMYLGKLIEIAPKGRLYDNPLHPYTQLLLSAIPEVKLKNPSGYRPLAGELPNPANPPKGCRLCGRCPYEFEKCREASPELTEVEPGHVVACFLHSGKEVSGNG
jgi:oligopeptide/dipeptide ABC transporter ATP-binding protein